MTKDEFIELIENKYIEVDKICEILVKLEDIELDINIRNLPNKKWYCEIIETTPKVLISCNDFSTYSMRNAVISCINKKFNIGD